MKLDTKLAFEAPDTEVDSMMVVKSGDFCRQKQVLVRVGVLCDPHDRHQFLQGANAQLKEVELVLKDGQRMLHNTVEFNFSLGDELTAALNVWPYSGKDKLGVNFAITFD